MRMNLENKTIFIGLGAQKTGTTWLDAVLRQYREVAMPAGVKELHYFNAKWLDQYGIYAERVSKVESLTKILSHEMQQENALRKKGVGYKDLFRHTDLTKKIKKLSDMVDVVAINSDKEYLSYLNKISFEKRVTGEITPAYSMLPLEGLENIKTLLPDVKIIFMMRDPIDRIVSQMKFRNKLRAKKGLKEIDIYTIDLVLNDDVYMKRSDYVSLLKNVEQVFSKENILILFYEDLLGIHTTREIRRIEKFLNLEEKDESEIRAFKEEKHNTTTAKGVTITDEMKSALGSRLNGIYGYVMDHFDAVPTQWRQNHEKYCKEKSSK